MTILPGIGSIFVAKSTKNVLLMTFCYDTLLMDSIVHYLNNFYKHMYILATFAWTGLFFSWNKLEMFYQWLLLVIFVQLTRTVYYLNNIYKGPSINHVDRLSGEGCMTKFHDPCIFKKLYMECCPRWGEGGSKSGEKLSTWFMDGP